MYKKGCPSGPQSGPHPTFPGFYLPSRGFTGTRRRRELFSIGSTDLEGRRRREHSSFVKTERTESYYGDVPRKPPPWVATRGLPEGPRVVEGRVDESRGVDAEGVGGETGEGSVRYRGTGRGDGTPDVKRPDFRFQVREAIRVPIYTWNLLKGSRLHLSCPSPGLSARRPRSQPPTPTGVPNRSPQNPPVTHVPQTKHRRPAVRLRWVRHPLRRSHHLGPAHRDTVGSVPKI